ncbi:uncharacterized protein A4U43_C06F14420 [Asparagus officinalis]|uniref:Aminotransferase class V domain-containing protein n=1 Tax=Asparagus officinalis TaxID=4686 RepID=A0A5P1ESG9_ASPOF|nr:uncharacterized protein A4U43_C06F14420 [Asparagus officinalis]
MTGARYPYLWMRMAQESGWHVLLDACALGPKDLDTLGLSLIQPDFLVCSFFKVVGEVPSGFAALLVKKSSASSHLLGTTSAVSRGIGAIRIIPAATLLRSQLTDDFSGTFSENDTAANLFPAPPLSGQICNSTRDASKKHYSVMGAKTSETCQTLLSALSDDDDQNEVVEIVEAGKMRSAKADAGIFECMGLDHADSLGLLLISSRLRYITNWLVMALTKLRHPNSSSEANGHPLVRTYGPRIKFERGPAISFNVFDWKGEKVEPALVQKLADRSNISLGCGFLHNIWFSDKYEQERDGVLETRRRSVCHQTNKKIKDHEGNIDLGIAVVNASLGFLANFEDAYKLWSFIARFLDADFVEKERWRYMALNQKMIEKNIYIQHGFINLRVKSRCVLPTIITIAFYRDSSKLCLLFNHIEYIFTYMGKLMLVCPSKIGVTPSPQSSSLLQSSSIYKLKSYRRTEFEAYQYRFELEARVFLYWHVYMYVCGWKVWADRRTGSR